ncbi:unnamed protein product, partial [Phaeothamnion confervicola]
PSSRIQVPVHYKECLKCILLPHGIIQDKVEKLADDIATDYADKTVHLLCVLKGGSAFFHDLSTALRRAHLHRRLAYIPFTFDFIRAKSYDGTESTGSVEISGVDLATLAGKHVLLVEDIIDTG